MYILLFPVFWLVSISLVIGLVYRRELKRLWNEPMLRYPVIIFESDDWGVGPAEQKDALTSLIQLFSQYTDQHGQNPVMTLGMILAEPDFSQIRKNEGSRYYSRDLNANQYHDLLETIKQGQERHIFSVQLHGMEHYWPDALMSSAKNNNEVKKWLFESESPVTEKLPSFLQSRWCDSSRLPSGKLDKGKIFAAIEREINLFKALFGRMPSVIVPPTFVWSHEMVQGYSNNNINTIVTPGRQYIGRDAQGKLQANGRRFYNGEIDDSTGTQYIVRDVYFEPKMGHKSEQVMTQIIAKVQAGRPALLEMHRFNFLSDFKELNNDVSIRELKNLLELIAKQLPHCRYVSTENLADIFKLHDSQWLVSSKLKNMSIWLTRVQIFFKYIRLAKYSGFNFILNLMLWIKKGA